MKRPLPETDPGSELGPDLGQELGQDLGPELVAHRELNADLAPSAGGAVESVGACFTIDAVQGTVVEANASAWDLLGFDATCVPPVALDGAMPAMQDLRRRACARQVSGNENLIFWTSRGIRQLHCQVRRVQSGAAAAGASLMRVRVIDAVAYPAQTDAAAVGRLSARDATATAKLAHELRTPLSAVIAYAEVLKDEHFGPFGNSRYREYARNIYDSARHALGVVDGMLAGNPAASGLPELAFTDLDPTCIAENCMAVARPLADQAGLELQLVIEVGMRAPRVVADEVSLKQMLLNLLTNAIKFARVGDRVTVEVAYDPGGTLRIAVADTGPGMSEPPLALEGGKGGPNGNKVRNAGLGIGLPLTRALAEANGAALVIDSAPGRGTQATIVFGKDRVVPV